MGGIMLCMGVALLGADAGKAGWGPSPADKVFQYVVQIAPDALGQLNSGYAIESDIPPQLKGIRRVRITVGTGDLAQVAPLAQTPPEQPPEKPRPLTPPRDSKPLPAKQATYVSDEGSESSQPKSIARKNDENREDAPNPQPPKPWMALTLTAVALCGSLGGNAYLVWIAMDSRRRYRELFADPHAPQSPQPESFGQRGDCRLRGPAADEVE